MMWEEQLELAPYVVVAGVAVAAAVAGVGAGVVGMLKLQGRG